VLKPRRIRPHRPKQHLPQQYMHPTYGSRSSEDVFERNIVMTDINPFDRSLGKVDSTTICSPRDHPLSALSVGGNGCSLYRGQSAFLVRGWEFCWRLIRPARRLVQTFTWMIWRTNPALDFDETAHCRSRFWQSVRQRPVRASCLDDRQVG